MNLSILAKIYPGSLALALAMLSLPSLRAQDGEPATLDETVVSPPRGTAPSPRLTPPPSAPPAPPAPAEQPPLVLSDDTFTVPTLERVREELALTPGGISVIDAETYKEGRATNLKDALDYAPGVYVQPRFGADESRIAIRGSGIQRTFHGRGLMLLQDGAPLNLGDGGFDMQSVEPLAAQYVEVYRGANALRYGSTTLGGAINFVSQSGYTAAPLQARFEAGSFNTVRGQVSGAGVEGPLDYYATFTNSTTDGFREHSQQSTQRFFGNLGWRINDSLESRLYVTYVNTRSELPGSLSKEQMYLDPTVAARNPFAPMFDNVLSDWRRDFELFRVANRTTARIDDETEINLSTFFSYKDLDHPILFVIDQVTKDFGFDLNYVNRADIAGRENRLTLGILSQYGIADDNRFVNNLGQRGPRFSNNLQESLNISLYAEDVFYVADRLAVVFGAQGTYSLRDSDDRFPPFPGRIDSSDRQEFWGFAPKFGLLHDTAEWMQSFVNVSRSFEPPSFGELVAPAIGGAGLVDLDAQTGTTLEVGTRGANPSGRFSWDAAYFRSWIDKELLALSVAPNVTQTVNADHTIHQGVELGFELSLLEGIFTGGRGGKSVLDNDRIVLRNNYLWSDFRFSGDREFGDNRLGGIPEHYLRLELLYRHPSGFYFGPNLETAFGDWFVDSDNTLSANSYAILGLRAGFRTQQGLSFYVDARNLADEIYAATTGVVHSITAFNANQFFPGDGRSVFVGVEYQF